MNFPPPAHSPSGNRKKLVFLASFRHRSRVEEFNSQQGAMGKNGSLISSANVYIGRRKRKIKAKENSRLIFRKFAPSGFDFSFALLLLLLRVLRFEGEINVIIIH